MNAYLLGVLVGQALVVAVSSYCVWNLCQASKGFGSYLGLVYNNSEKFSVFTKLVWSMVAVGFLIYAFMVSALGVALARDKLDSVAKAYPSLANVSVIRSATAAQPDQIENLITRSNNPANSLPGWDTWHPTSPSGRPAEPEIDIDSLIAEGVEWHAAQEQENATVAIMSIGAAILIALATIGSLAFSFILTVGFLHAFTKLWSPGAIPDLARK